MAMKTLFGFSQTVAIAFLCAVVSVGCDSPAVPVEEVIPKAKSLEGSADGKPSAEESSDQPKETVVGGYQFTIPAGWTSKPLASDVLLAEYSVPGEGGPGRLTLSMAGGDIESNLSRWRGQFRRGPEDPEARESPIRFDGQSGTLLELTGTFTDMFNSKDPSRNWQMLGAAIPIGPTNFFVKLTGPRSTVESQRETFVKFVESAKKR